jgi:branched-chain amino acid transport system substrate-binding protein
MSKMLPAAGDGMPEAAAPPLMLERRGALLGLALAGLGARAARAQSQDPVKIGVTMPLTGNSAFDGQQTVRGMQTAAGLVNAQGGILGRKLELVVLDDKANPEEGVNAVKRLISESRVHAIASALNSSVGLAQVDATAGRLLHVVVLASAPAITEKGYANVFRVNTTSASKEQPLIEAMRGRVKKAAMLLTNDDYGRGLLAMYQQAWGSGGPQIVSANFFQLTETSFTPYLTKIRFERPDGFYVVAQSSQLTTILKQAGQVGFRPETIWTVGASINPTVLRLGGDTLNGVISADNYLTSIDSPANAAFLDAFRKQFPGEEPQFYHAVGFDAVMVTAKALQMAGTVDDWQKAAGALRGLTYDSPRGKLSFDAKGQVQLDTFLIRVEDGQPRILR